MRVIFLPFFLILFFTTTVFSQNIFYPNLYLQPVKVTSGMYKGYEKYVIGDLGLFNSTKRYDNRFFVISEITGNKLLAFQDTLEFTTEIIPHFFKPEIEDGTLVITVSSMANYSMGTYVFLIKGDIAYKSGFIPFSSDDYNFSSLGNHCMIHEINGQIIMSFDDVNLIDHTSEEVITSESIKFNINEKSILKLNIEN